MLIDFLCDPPREWRIAERYGEDGRVALVHPLFDYPLIVPTYDLMTDDEVDLILENANIPSADYADWYGVPRYTKK